MSDFVNWLMSIAALVVPSLAPVGPPTFNGYVEADYVYAAPLTPGRITRIGVKEGDVVIVGQALFSLDNANETAALQAAEGQIEVASANLENLLTGGREAEIEVIRASVLQAEAEQTLAQTTLDRDVKLFERGLVPPAQVDADRASLAALNAQVMQLRAQLRVAELPARDAQRVAAERTLEVARAQADIARSNLANRDISAPTSGIVDKVFYETGEIAATGAPLVSIFQPDALKAIFFIPEPLRAGFRLSDRLGLTCDGCASGLTATVTHLAASPQYTPPIIFSQDERTRLVYRAEARLDAGSGLLPGQPITLERPK